MDLVGVQAEWTLGRYPRAQLPEVAAQAMMAGFEGPFILDLVGYAAPSLDRLKPEVVEGAFREMGLAPVTKTQAALRLARVEALRILRKQTSWRSGAEALTDLARLLEWEEMPEPLQSFRTLEDWEETWTREEAGVEAKVIELAWALLEE